MFRRWMAVLVAVMAVAGCAKEKPPAELIGTWQRQDADSLGKPVLQRLNLKEDGKYSVSRTSTGSTISDGTRTKDGLEILHSGNWTIDRETMVLTLQPTYMPIAGVNTAALEPKPLKSAFGLFRNQLLIQQPAALMMSGPSAPMGGNPVAGGTAPIALQKAP